MPRRIAPISRAEFEERAGPNLAKGRWYKPEVRPVEVDGFPCLVKDYSRCPAPWRWTYGWFMVFRETHIYEALDGLPGIPRYFGVIPPYAFVLERVAGREAGDVKRGTLPGGFLARLLEVVRAMHARGVVHGDLRQRRNVIVGDDGDPRIIDFASGFLLPPGSFLLRIACRPDLSGVAKLKAKHAPETLTEKERRLLVNIDRFRPFRRWRLRRRAIRGHQTDRTPS